MTIKKKLLTQTILLAVIPALIVAIIITLQATKSSYEALEVKTEQRLTSLRELKKSQIDAYLSNIKKQVSNYSNNIAVKEAAQNFISTFHEDGSPTTTTEQTRLSSYYHNAFASKFTEINNNRKPDVAEKLNRLDELSKYYQSKYIVNNSHPFGEKHQLHIGGNTNYDNAHQKYHAMFTSYLESFGYYDIFIVDAKSGHIVYSVYKELDFATSLFTGPYSDTGIATSFKSALALNNTDDFAIVDFSSYFPSYDQPASFISSPITDAQGNVNAVLIFQMPIDGINNIMTNNQQWQKVGLGLSGETYLVGPDQTLRSESRFLIEDKANYLAALKAAKNQPNINKIETYNSALSLQYVATPGVQAALQGKSGYSTFPDYRQVDVLSAYTSIQYGNATWALMAELDVEEAFHDAIQLNKDMYNYMLISLSIIALISITIGIFSSKSLVAPLNVLVKRINDISEGDGDLTVQLSLAKRNDEIGSVGKSFNLFVEKIRHIIADIDHHASQLASSSEELSAVTHETNSVVSKQKNKTDLTSNVMCSLTTNINEIANNSGITSQLTNQANSASSEGAVLSKHAEDSIQQLVNSVDSASQELDLLNGQVEKISEILGVIDSIADQTNLLALNAAIEAARAGESGRGFSVVADEVRTLAAKTQESTIEIQHRISELKSSSKNSVTAMQTAALEAEKGIEMVQKTAQSLTTVSSIMSDVQQKNAANASVAHEQSENVEGIHQNIIDIAQYTENTSSASLQTSQASNELAKLAVNMSGIVQQFRF